MNFLISESLGPEAVHSSPSRHPGVLCTEVRQRVGSGGSGCGRRRTFGLRLSAMATVPVVHPMLESSRHSLSLRSSSAHQLASRVRSQFSQDAARLRSSRAARAAILCEASSGGTWAPVAKYISSGVWPRKAEWGCQPPLRISHQLRLGCHR